MAFKDLSGRRFGKLLAKERVYRNKRHTEFRCVCDCGSETVVESYTLQKGLSQSCGCTRSEVKPRLKHGMSKTKEHRTWCKIKDRCCNTRDKKYADYGARGIRVCDAWINDFEQFFRDVGPAPSPSYSIDRINNDGNYEPGNCRWATHVEQANNKRNNALYEYGGGTFTAREIVRRHAVHGDIKRFKDRVEKGWSVEMALMRPVIRNRLAV